MNNHRGATLVEIVSCLVILGVLAGMAFPLIEKMKVKLALHSEVSTLVEELRKARIFAIKSNAPVVFSYTDKGYMTFIDDGRNGGHNKDWVRQAGEQVLCSKTLGNGIDIILPESTFTSHRTRFSVGPGISAGAVVLQDSEGNKSKVIVNAVGRVRVQKL